MPPRIPKLPLTERINARLTPTDRAHLQELAEAAHVGESDIVRWLIKTTTVEEAIALREAFSYSVPLINGEMSGAVVRVNEGRLGGPIYWIWWTLRPEVQVIETNQGAEGRVLGLQSGSVGSHHALFRDYEQGDIVRVEVWDGEGLIEKIQSERWGNLRPATPEELDELPKVFDAQCRVSGIASAEIEGWPTIPDARAAWGIGEAAPEE